MKRFALVLVAIVIVAAVAFSVLLQISFFELDWNKFAVINDLADGSHVGVDYRILMVDGNPPPRMPSKFETRVPQVIVSGGRHVFSIERSINGDATIHSVSAIVEVGKRYHIVQSNGEVTLELEDPIH